MKPGLHRGLAYSIPMAIVLWIIIIGLILLIAGCEEITGHPRCDDDMAAPVLDIIEVKDWEVNCKPNFSNIDPVTGVRHTAWTDPARKTVWVWPDTPNFSDRALFKTLWHESGHVHGHSTELGADSYAYCHMTYEQRLGIGFRTPWPTSCKGYP